MPDWLNYKGIEVPDATPTGAAGLRLKNDLTYLANRAGYYAANGNDLAGTDGLALGTSTTASGDSSTVVGRSSRVGFAARTFTCSASGTTLTISGDVTAEFANGDTVLINPNTPAVATSVTRTISSVSFGGGNTTFTISSAINSTSTGGSVVSTSKAQNGTVAGNGNVSLALNGNVFGEYNFLNASSFSAVAVGLLNNQSGGTLNLSTGAITGTPAAGTAGRISTAVGIRNSASARYSTALGFTNSVHSAAINSHLVGGYNFTSSGSYAAVIFGLLNNQTGGTLDISSGAITGTPAAASTIGKEPIAVGVRNTTSGNYGIAMGFNNTCSGNYGMAFGRGNTASGLISTTFGRANIAAGNYSTAFGSGNLMHAASLNCQLAGAYNFATATSFACVAFGLLNNQDGSQLNLSTGEITSTPPAAGTPGRISTAVGIRNSSSGNYSSAIGFSNSMNAASQNCHLAGGYNFGSLTGVACVAFGLLNNQSGGTLNLSTGAITGTPAAAGTAGRISTAVGVRNSASGNYSSAVGFTNSMNTASLNSHLVGGYNFGSADSFASVAFGLLNNAQGDTLNTSTGAITGTITADTTIGRLGTAVGIQNAVSGNSAGAFGYSNTASSTNSWALGASVSNSTSNSVEVGPDNTNKVRVDSSGLNVLASIVTEKVGNSSATAKVGGTLTINTTAVGNVGSGEDDLITYTVPAAALNTNGDRLEITAWGTFAANGNNKTLKLKFGSTTLYDSTAVAANAGSWVIRATIIRTGATTQQAIASIVSSNSLVNDDANFTTPAETLSGTVVLKCTGEATSDDDIIQKGMTVNWFPANT